jgi:hypothetical protein
MSTYTYEQVVANFQAALKRIKTGVLRDSPEDRAFIERIITQYILVNQLEPTADNFSAAFKAHAKVLPWLTKPAALLAEERESKTEIIPVAQNVVGSDEFTARVRVGEQKDADAKEHAGLVKQCVEIIDGYNPTKNNQYDGRERQEMQALWIKDLHKAKTQSVEHMRSFTKSLAAARAKRYADRERAAERL